MKCIDLLVSEHKTILRALNILDEMSLRVEKGEPPPQDDVEALLGFLRTYADDHHQGKEETALFPELTHTAAAQTGPVHHMLFEHDQERSLVEGLEDALRTKAGQDFIHFANRLTGLLRTHIYKEDHILFEIIEKALSTEQDERVSAEFSKIDRGVADKLNQECELLRRLEWKYLGKAA
jgi:hemerythrin-like domain-containing protein